MAGINGVVRANWEKSFPPIQQKALRGMGQIFFSAWKKNTDTVTSSTTLVPDSELFIPNVPANIAFCLTGYLVTTCAAAGNIKIDLNNSPGAAVSALSIQSIFSNAAGAQTPGAIQTALNTGANGGTTNQTIAVSLNGVVYLSNPGQLGLQFAQQASSGTGTTIGPGSYIYLEPMDAVLFS